MTRDSARVLVLCTRDWFGAARLPAALARAGFQVASLGFPGALISHSRYVATHFPLPLAGSDAELLAALEHALTRFEPALVIPGDDPAVELLHALAAELATRPDSGGEVSRCLVRSLGDSRHYPKVQSRRALHALGVELGLRAPEQAVVANAEQAAEFAEKYGFPLILKAENTCAGYGTSICRDRAALSAGFAYFDARYGARNQTVDAVTVQRFIVGRTAMRAISAHEGEVLGGLSAYKRETHPAPTGPSTVVELFENAEMAHTVASVTRAFQLTGFASFDFMIEDESGAAYLIELNPRPTPICHLGGAFGDDLCGALWQRLTGSPPRAVLPRAEGRLVVLFPQEWVRNANSPYFQQHFHDVPWGEPELTRALTAMGVEQMGWTHMRREETRRESLRALAAR
jgi:predicted ATP-grasp superfamily ATP-dependent carboligase